ncbi:MAG: hypothetical protein MAG453_01664 [Calditrichaeota bacterium]|nr:hypothetical protein [Calditrichota bacterium]
MQFAKKSKPTSSIPTASLPDIIFMLLIFFMVVTVFKEFNGLPVLTPAARTTEKLESKRHVAYLWADEMGRVSIDDKIVSLDEVEPIMAEKFANDRRLIISMKIDQDVEMGLVTDIQEEFRDAYTLRISYATRIK